VASTGGTERHPADTERLKRYWTEGEGGKRIQWGTPGDYNRCIALTSAAGVPPDQVHGYCQNLHIRATGAPAGHAPAELAARAAEGKKP
jgi:hypothetical protein